MTDRIKEAKGLFTKPIESRGCHVSLFAQHIGIDMWTPERGYVNLAAALEGGNRMLKGPEYDRVADRMIQKMRKAGLIEPVRGKGWRWTEQPCAGRD